MIMPAWETEPVRKPRPPSRWAPGSAAVTGSRSTLKRVLPQRLSVGGRRSLELIWRLDAIVSRASWQRAATRSSPPREVFAGVGDR